MTAKLYLKYMRGLGTLLSVFLLACSSGPPEQKAPPTLPVTQPPPISMDTLPIAYLLGKFEPDNDSNFVPLVKPYAAGSALNQYLHKETFAAFKEMYEAAQTEGISLRILSGTRNFDYQKSIWEGKWSGKRLQNGKNLAQEVPDPQARALEILRTSSMPGTSRHHWGTDIDLNAFNNGYFKSGEGARVYEWLQSHAAQYGFCQPYTDKALNGRTGYEEERWHWSYKPLAQQYLRAYEATISESAIRSLRGNQKLCGGRQCPMPLVVNDVYLWMGPLKVIDFFAGNTGVVTSKRTQGF